MPKTAVELIASMCCGWRSVYHLKLYSIQWLSDINVQTTLWTNLPKEKPTDFNKSFIGLLFERNRFCLVTKAIVVRGPDKFSYKELRICTPSLTDHHIRCVPGLLIVHCELMWGAQ